MTDIINLNKARKENSRSAKEKQAAQNRAKFGRTKAEKDLEKLKAEKAKRLLDAHKREDDINE